MRCLSVGMKVVLVIYRYGSSNSVSVMMCSVYGIVWLNVVFVWVCGIFVDCVVMCVVCELFVICILRLVVWMLWVLVLMWYLLVWCWRSGSLCCRYRLIVFVLCCWGCCLLVYRFCWIVWMCWLSVVVVWGWFVVWWVVVWCCVGIVICLCC